MLKHLLSHRLVHDAGVDVIGLGQKVVAGAQYNVNVPGATPTPIVKTGSDSERYLPTVTFRVDQRTTPAVFGQRRLQQGLQVGVNCQHALDEGNQFRLAASFQIRVQFLHCTERIGLVRPGKQQCRDVLATSATTHRAGTIGRLDPFGVADNPQVVGLGSGAFTPGLEGVALKTRLEDGPVLEVTATALETPGAYPTGYGPFAQGGKGIAHDFRFRFPDSSAQAGIPEGT